MAFTREKKGQILGDSLDSFVSGIANQFRTQMGARNLELETKFNASVLEDGISLEDQLTFRKNQLKEVADDPTETKRLRGEISNLTQRIRDNKFTTEYLQKLTDANTGMSSIDTVISWLEDQRANTTDPAMLDKINTDLSNAQVKKFEQTKQLISDTTQYALSDKSTTTLSTQIDKVSAAKAQALLNGDDNLAATYDLQLKSLTKALAETNITKKIANTAVSSISGSADAVGLLTTYQNNISTAAANSGPITVGGVTYNSEQEFWNDKLTSYLADRTANGFLARFASDQSDKIKALYNTANLDPNVLAEVSNSYNSLLSNPQLQPFTQQLTNDKAQVMQDGADLIGQQILNGYAVDYDINKAVGAFNNLQSTGVNVEKYYKQLMVSAANVKSSQVSSILSAANNYIQNNPGASSEDAINYAIRAGAGNTLSPEQLTATPEGTIANNLQNTVKNQTGTNDTRTTIQPTPTPAPAPTPTPAPATPVPSVTDALMAKAKTVSQALPNSPYNPTAPTNVPAPTPVAQPVPQPAPVAVTPAPTPAPAPATPAPTAYVIKYGDTLGQIALRHNTTVENLAKLNNIQDPNKIQAGATLKIG